MRPERNKLITDNLGLVHSCARRYTGRGIEYDDLYQAGCVGLVKAVDGFDSERSVRFSTYAVPVILGEIRRLFRDGGSVKISRSLKELGLKATRCLAEFEMTNGREPRISELAALLGSDPETTSEAINAVRSPVSLTVYTDSDDADSLDIPEDCFDVPLTDSIAVRQVLNALKSNDRKLIYLRYFKGHTQSDTAAQLGMTQVQVSRREKAIINSLRSEMVG